MSLKGTNPAGLIFKKYGRRLEGRQMDSFLLNRYVRLDLFAGRDCFCSSIVGDCSFTLISFALFAVNYRTLLFAAAEELAEGTFVDAAES